MNGLDATAADAAVVFETSTASTAHKTRKMRVVTVTPPLIEWRQPTSEEGTLGSASGTTIS
jgi:hypothetical protein